MTVLRIATLIAWLLGDAGIPLLEVAHAHRVFQARHQMPHVVGFVENRDLGIAVAVGLHFRPELSVHDEHVGAEG